MPLPVIPNATFNVTTYGAVGDNKTDNTTAIQAALTAAGNAGGGTVTVPSGTFLSGPIVLGNSTRLDLASGAVLKMLPRASYPGTVVFITANNAHDIALTGAGTIDGQGQDWWTAFAADSTVTRPQEVSFSNCTRVQISGIRLQNSPEEHIWVKGDTNLTITGITISTLAVSGQSPPKIQMASMSQPTACSFAIITSRVATTTSPCPARTFTLDILLSVSDTVAQSVVSPLKAYQA